MKASAIVLFAHGSREPDWARPVERLRDRVAQALGREAVELAFLEHTQPTLEQAIEALCARGARQISVVPLFLAAGGHLKRDLPRMLEDIMRGHPGVSMQATPPLGEVESILDSIADWIVKDCAAR
jgi:sirohydrochlorin cobaltochelatase